MGAQVSDTDIFISYSREDRARAHDFARALTDRGLNVWWDAALHSGENFDEVIEAQLKAAKAVLVLWSPRSVKSRWVRAEATLADRRNKLIPVIIEPCDRPIIFELAHTIDLAHWHGDGDDPAWQTFLSDLMRLARPEASAAAPYPSSKPISIKVEEGRGLGLSDYAQVDDDEEEYQPTQLINWRSKTAQSHWLLQPSADVPEMQYVIGPEGLKIGRGQSADVVLRDSQISRNHCVVMLKEDELHVVDLNSTNGTFVDEERIGGEAVLPVGSTLRVGSILLVHQLRESDSA